MRRLVSGRRFAPRALVACAAGLAAVTWWRFAVTGTLKIDDTPVALRWAVPTTAAWIAFGAGAIACYAAALRCPGESLRRLLPVALALHAAAGLALPYSSNDLFSNLAYGRMVDLGLDPYAAGPAALPAGDPFRALVGSMWMNAPSGYGPVVTWLSAAAVHTSSVLAAVIAFKAAMLATALGTVLVAYRLCQRHLGRREGPRAFAFLALNPLFAHEISGQAHNDGLMLLILAAFAWAALEEREVVAVALVAVALCVKVVVAPVLGLYVLHLARKRLRTGISAACAAAVVALLVHGPASSAAVATRALQVQAAAPTLTSRSIAHILCDLAGRFGPAAQLSAYRAFSAVALALGAGLAVRAAALASSARSALHEALVFLMVYLLVAAPWVQPWYTLVLLPLALVDGERRWREAVGVATATYVVTWFSCLSALHVVIVNAAALLWVARGALRNADPLAAAGRSVSAA
jgi:alpha-1,6-mannosyltransferase